MFTKNFKKFPPQISLDDFYSLKNQATTPNLWCAFRNLDLHICETFQLRDMLHQKTKIKRPAYQWNTLFIGKKKSVIYFTFVVLLFDLF